ncbi:hypothetical protein DQP57_00545 [Mycobacterium colombiense]|uniref:Thoeris anti-defense 2-like domain-containing protein n=1 Tax=Mycobacterium colombiense TaxID=339268 RepID=A0A329MIW0_9MYCO|nr:DUF2829 domain-containing protein [Mycobacterium colombiense]RAV17547.1 hypothetical protein DQP57_00545 [Mycobacterium colombiense]
MDYSFALHALQLGHAVARIDWDGDGLLQLQLPDEDSKMTLPYVYITTANGERVPWSPSQADLLADDWYTIDLPLAPF